MFFRLGLAILLCCSLLGVAVSSGLADPLEDGAGHVRKDAIIVCPPELLPIEDAIEVPDVPLVLEFTEGHEPLRDMMTNHPDLACEIARRLMTPETQDGPAPAPDGEESTASKDESPRASSPQAVLDLIELMRKAAEEK